MDFNLLLRESRRLESAMEGVTSSMRARPGVTSGGFGAGDAASVVGVHALRVPPLTRSLAQLDVASAKLVRAQGAPHNTQADSQAQLLLAARGIDVRKQARALKELQQATPMRGGAGTAAAVGPLPIEHFHPLDIEGYLNQQQQLLCHSAMEDAARVTSETYRRHDLASLDEDWDRTKRDILDGLGFRAGKSAIAQAAGEVAYQQATEDVKRKAGALSSPQQYADAAAASGPVLGMEQSIYARSVSELNRHRVRRTPVAVLSLFRQAAAAVDEFFQRQQPSDGAQASASANGLAVGDVTDCWDVLQCLLRGDKTDAVAAAVPLVEKGFAAGYDAPASSPEGARFRMQLIDGAKSYSENLFAAYIKRVVAAHPEARRGTQQQRAPFARQISTYVSVLGDKLPAACRDFQLEGVPLWPQVYYLFRCGHVEDALQLLRQALEQSGVGLLSRSSSIVGSSGGHHEQLTRVFVECMEKRAQGERALPSPLWLSLHEEFQRDLAAAVNSARAHGASSSQAGAFVDPFKLALYHLLGRFRLPAHLVDLSALVAPTTEDYLWVKLSLLLDTSSARSVLDAGKLVPDGVRDHIDASSLRLESLQADLLSRGSAAFNPDGRHPLSYFKVLLLSLQFEQAVYFLIKTAHFTVGVHFAIALDYAGVLHTHSHAQAELLVALPAAGATHFALHYSRVLRKYVESFVRSHPFEAFQYLYLLHGQGSAAAAAAAARAKGLGHSNASLGLLASPGAAAGSEDGAAIAEDDVSFAALRDLLLETRDFDLLVGTIGAPAGVQAASAQGDTINTSRGLLYNYFSPAEAQSLLVSTGSALSAHGLALDAIHVYLLAYRFDLAVELTLKTLAPLVSSPVQSDERQTVVAAAQRVRRVVRAHQEAGQAERVVRVSEAADASLVALHQLLSLVNYFDHYHLGPSHYDAALAVLSPPSLTLVPLEAARVREAAAAFLSPQHTHVQVRRALANVAVSVMDIYYVQYQLCKRDMHTPAAFQAQHAQREHTKQQRLATLRAQAAALTSFLGLIQNSMQIDADVFAKIMSVEALMAA